MRSAPHLLVVDDDREIRDLLTSLLARRGYKVTAARDEHAMRWALSNSQIDLVILDVMLPGKDGLAICRELSAEASPAIIMLTARGEATDRVVGLEMGADDYVAKPFDVHELEARIKAVLRRHRAAGGEPAGERHAALNFAGWTLDLRQRQLTSPDGVLVDVTSGEFDLLAVFAERPNRVLSRNQLLDIAHGRGSDPFDRSIDIRVVTGPAEVQGAIHAFNQMQERLQRFIDDRMQMVAAMSHDLRTPITRLRLRTEYLDDATQRAKALCDLDEMEHMINEVLGFARDEAQVGTSVNLDLSSMLQTICDDMADKGHRLEYVARAHPKVWCRANAIRRCLTNVIDNAVKYGRAARIALSTEGQDVVVHVDDRGPGIPAELREQVFRPFFRADASRNRDSGGTGLGLSVARNIARAHGGDVELADRRRGGLRVIVRLPGRIAPPDLPADAPATGDSADQPGGGRLPDPKIS